MTQARETTADLFAGLHPIFRAIADREDGGRYYLDRPFATGDHVYATDGRWLVRAPLGRVDPENLAEIRAAQEGKRLVSQAGIDAVFAVPGGWDADPTAIPDGLKEYRTCLGCGGDGRSLCPACEHEHECGDCDGGGREKVTDPIAFGETPPYHIATYYLAVLRRHGASLFLPRSRDDKMAARFVLPDGGEGLVMPRKVESPGG